jgi:hypothetical protein
LQNKAKVKMGNMTISPATTKSYPNEQRTMSNKRRSKQTQFKPNSPAPLLRRERIQNLGAKRISRFVGPAPKIKNPASRIKHLPHFAVHSWLHCAKQSQCQNGQYKHKYSKNKGLCRPTTNNEQQTPFKTKPIQTQSQPKTRALLDPERSRRANQTQFSCPEPVFPPRNARRPISFSGEVVPAVIAEFRIPAVQLSALRARLGLCHNCLRTAGRIPPGHLV